MRSIRWAWMVVFVVVLATACGSGAPSDVAAGGLPSQPTGVDEAGNPIQDTADAARDCAYYGMAATGINSGINKFVNRSDAGVLGTFEAVGEPKNDPSGSGVWGTASFRVQQVIFDSAQLPVRPGDVVSLSLMASNECGLEAYDELSGPVAPQQRHLLLLDHLASGKVSISYKGNWRVDVQGGREVAVNRDSRRNAALDVAISRVKAERDAGPDPSRDPGTEHRPFG